MTFHIITPFSRPQHVEKLVAMFIKAGGARNDVLWYPVYHDPEHLKAIGHVRGWVRPINAGALPTDWDLCYWKCNLALDAIGQKDGDYYAFLCDDDTYEPGFFDRMRAVCTQDVDIPVPPCTMIVSERRYGGNEKDFGGVLTACPENMRVCHIGLEQFFVPGEIMRGLRFNNHCCADGGMAENQLAKRPCAYMPDLHVNWNLLSK